MKPILIIAVFFTSTLTFQSLHAQINLDVAGRGIIRAGTPRLDLYDTDNNRTETYLFSSNGDLYLHSRFGDILFRASDDAGFDTRMFIDGTDGNIGIGTSTPNSKLHILDGGEASLTQHGYLLLGDINSANLVIDNNEIQARSNGNSNTLFIQPSGNGDVSMDGNTFYMEAEDNRIGIGTSSPDVKLNVSGGTDVTPNGGGYLQLGNNNGNNLAFDNNEIMARNNNAGSDLHIQREEGNLLLCGQTGRVGIGVQTSATLPSGYLLAVDGGILAEEVVVTLSSDWPDYVFEKDYPLMSIPELAKSIQENGHLPGIPSANEMEKNGQSLGQIQHLMMEKIEELSLYIIELENRLAGIEKQNLVTNKTGTK